MALPTVSTSFINQSLTKIMRRLLMTRWQQRLYWSNCKVLPREKDSTDRSFTTQSEYAFRWQHNPAINTQAVVCTNHYEEDLSWILLSRYPVIVYTKTEKSSPNYLGFNKVYEVPSYLRYIIDHYEVLPEFSIFVHGHRGSPHQDNFIDVIINELEFTEKIITLSRHDHYKYIEEGTDLPYMKYSWLSDNWEDIFGMELALPKKLAFYGMAQFAVHKSCITQYKIEFWEHLYDWCLKTELPDWLSSRIFEYAWFYLFSRQPIFPKINE